MSYRDGYPFDPWDEIRIEGTPSDIIARSGPRGPGGARRAIAAPPPQPARAALEIGPPDLVQYPEGSALRASGRNAAVANGTTATLATFEVPPGQVSVVRSIILSGVNLVVGLAATFAFRVNGSPVPGWDALTIPAQNAATGVIGWGPDETYIRAPDGAVLTLTVSVSAGGPADVSGQFGGWYYPTTLAERAGSAYRL